jgi:hypothetical protein
MTFEERVLETRRALERDVARHERPRQSAGLLRALALVGSVGWPIALLTTGGALIGHFVDSRFGQGNAATLACVAAGALVGSTIAFRTLLRSGALRRGDP